MELYTTLERVYHTIVSSQPTGLASAVILTVSTNNGCHFTVSFKNENKHKLVTTLSLPWAWYRRHT